MRPGGTSYAVLLTVVQGVSPKKCVAEVGVGPLNVDRVAPPVDVGAAQNDGLIDVVSARFSWRGIRTVIEQCLEKSLSRDCVADPVSPCERQQKRSTIGTKRDRIIKFLGDIKDFNTPPP